MDFLQLVQKKNLSQTELAALLDLNQSSISKAISAGIVTADADWLQQTREYLHHTIEVAAGRDSDLLHEATRYKRLQADRLALELRQQRHELIPEELVRTYWINACSIMRNKMLGLPSRFKSIVADLSPGNVGKLDDLVREILSELSVSRIPARVHKLFESWELEGLEPDARKTTRGNGKGARPISRHRSSTTKTQRSEKAKDYSRHGTRRDPLPAHVPGSNGAGVADNKRNIQGVHAATEGI